MKNLPATGKTSKRRKQEKMFGLSKKRRIKNSWKVKAINERIIKFVGKMGNIRNHSFKLLSLKYSLF